MPTINVGRVRPLWKGTYDYQTAYDFFDWVSYNGSSYIVISSLGSAAGILPTNTSYWACVAEQGEIGPIGPKGEDGDKGAYIGQLVMTLVPISDSGVHLLDGSLLTVGGVYDAFITKVSSLLSTNPNLFCTQTEFDASVSAYGACGKFVYTAGVSLRLPKVSDIVQCTTDVSQCSALVEAGLPGAVGAFTTTTTAVASEASGMVSVEESASNGGASNTAAGTTQKVTIDLSDASDIYGNSTTVQPQVIKALVYMVVSSSVKTEVEVDIDNITTDLNAISGSVATNTQDISALQTSVATNTQDISALQTSVATNTQDISALQTSVATDLNGKAGVDLANVNTAGKAVIANLGMPSSRSVILTYTEEGQFTVPADGYVVLRASTSQGGIYIVNISNGIIVSSISERMWALGCILPVKKGDIVQVKSWQASSHSLFFLYAEGSQP